MFTRSYGLAKSLQIPEGTLVSELLAGSANFSPCEVLCRNVLQHPGLRRGYVVKPAVQDIRLRVL